GPAGTGLGPEQGAVAAAPGLVDLEGREADPFGPSTNKALVFIFVSNDCPISNRYAPEIKRLHAEYGPRGVALWLVHPNADESAPAIRQHTRDFHFTCGVLRDPKHALVKRAQARVTPEAAVFLPGGQ